MGRGAVASNWSSGGQVDVIARRGGHAGDGARCSRHVAGGWWARGDVQGEKPGNGLSMELAWSGKWELS